ncbi:MAG: putative toxin-antitoxin system toxin component, PIN family [Tannerella sp.]|jgi:putative PIN family toxin of toxin-antitoxin system|nr:putative toxin-antitoxin system toxin component, PIN family [Tannerella sp.]
MAGKSCKLVIDTNVWISFLIGKSLKGLQRYINSKAVKVVTCKEQMLELTIVLQRPKMQKYFSEIQIIEFFDLLDESARLIDLHTTIDICRDAKDNYLLALAIDSDADYLISGDADLLEIKQIGKTHIVNYADFRKLFY